ncbi:hypothetical protein DH2020_020390 [Rehmannia glutinosa]|uniref:Glutaredoxin domain-containing protein n=1 Tax=Rehmannia glutinosa TaxID=99300 RepID=A0ABR0WIU7_REHGL
MGCVSSTFLNQDDEFSQIGGSAAFSHHIVSLTSTTYGFLNLDPAPPSSDRHQHFPTTTVPPTPTPPTPPRITLGSLFPSPLSEPRSLRHQPLESINSWDLMSGLEADHTPSFRFSPTPLISKLSNFPVNKQSVTSQGNEEKFCPKINVIQSSSEVDVLRKSSKDLSCGEDLLDVFESICPPNGENKVVIYTTSLRGVRKTFDDCNAVRSAIEKQGISICERDISMDKGFRNELKELMNGKENNDLIPPRVFLKGRYIGGVEEVMKMVEEGSLGQLLQGLPRGRQERKKHPMQSSTLLGRLAAASGQSPETSWDHYLLIEESHCFKHNINVFRADRKHRESHFSVRFFEKTKHRKQQKEISDS